MSDLSEFISESESRLNKVKEKWNAYTEHVEGIIAIADALADAVSVVIEEDTYGPHTSPTIYNMSDVLRRYRALRGSEPTVETEMEYEPFRHTPEEIEAIRRAGTDRRQEGKRG